MASPSIADISSLQNEIESLKSELKMYKETHERFSTVFEHSRLGNKIIDRDLRILQVNQALVKLLGLNTKEEIIGSTILDYAPKDRHKDWAFLQEKLWAHLTNSFCLETCLLKKDGSLVWCQVTSILIPDGGKTLGYTILEDISEQHKLRQQREEFTSVASHELKTPITTLKATLQIIHQKLSALPNLTGDISRLSENAQKYMTKLVYLVEDLLNTTKIEQGQLLLNKTLFTIADVIDGCCSHIKLDGDYKIVYTGDHSLKVVADQHKIDQVLVNLVNNAVKYASKSKEIIVHVEKIEQNIKVSVKDQGEGIDEENLGHLFDRFYRVEKNIDNASGLGLGLYISSEIIKRHGGEMGVESILSKGSTFWFTLPNGQNLIDYVL